MNLSIATEFTTAPGPRHRSEGSYSGEEFRIDVLLPKLNEAITNQSKLIIDLDGTAGFGTSFLEETFGGLIRENGFALTTLNSILEFVSIEEPELLSEIRDYMDAAEVQRIKNRRR